MSLLKELYQILEESKAIYNSAKAGRFKVVERSQGATDSNFLVKGDNLALMKMLAEDGYAGKIKLIYIDPPFFSKSNYDAVIKIRSDLMAAAPSMKLYAYHDIWHNGMADYLRMLCARIYLMRDLLADDGCFFVHLDWHVVHYVKIMLDEIFGSQHFINEIIWNYKSGGTSKRHFSRKHDTLLFYSKTNRYEFNPQTEKSYNRELKPYRFKGVKEYKDDLGWYTLVNMKDVWQIDMVGRTSSERTGYATQKPAVLLERIIESCTREGDLCADFFGGSGTLAAAANSLRRRWICCDDGNLAFACMGKRMIKAKADFVALIQEDAGSDAHCAAKVEVVLLPIEYSDKKLLQVKLLSYEVSVGHIPLDKSDRDIVRKIIHKDSLCLIDYWSIDFQFDGKTHRPEQILNIGKEREVICEKVGLSFNHISLHFVDVFGNSTYQSVNLVEGAL